tara:strand:- start:374 stop:2101 length:1728 start_codon:yes stop_codon:yes gene_type:complete
MKKIWKIFDYKNKLDFIKLIIFTFVATILEAMSVALIFPIITVIFSENLSSIENNFVNSFLFYFQDLNKTSLVFVLMSIIFFIYFIKNVFLIFFTWYQRNFLAKFQLNTSSKIFHTHLSQPYSNFFNQNSSTIIRILETEVGHLTNAILYLTNILLEILVIFSLSVVLLSFLGIKIVLVLIALSIVPILYYFFTTKKVSKLGTERHIYGTKALKQMMQGIFSIKDLKILKKEDFFIKNYSQDLKKSLDSTKIISFLSTIPRTIIEMGAILILCLSTAVLATNQISGEFIAATVALLGVSALRMLPGINRLVQSSTSFKACTVALKNIDYILNLKNKFSNVNKNIRNTAKKLDIKNEIILKDVRFRYNSELDYVIENISLSVKKGEHIGIVGQSGCGKTTLLDLIIGLLECDNGEILVDSNKIESIKYEWQKSIGYVQQKIYLTDDTIKNNIAFGIPDSEFDQEKFNRAIKLSKLEKLLNTLPSRENTLVGENGMKISGGQIQRIGIARALYNDPSLLIFDEATNSLDLNTEKEIISEINNLKGIKTIIFVSHRMTALEMCDKIFKIEKGKLSLVN